MPYVKIDLKQKKGLTVKHKSRKLIEENTEYLCDPGVRTPRGQKGMGYIKTKTSESDP